MRGVLGSSRVRPLLNSFNPVTSTRLFLLAFFHSKALWSSGRVHVYQFLAWVRFLTPLALFRQTWTDFLCLHFRCTLGESRSLVVDHIHFHPFLHWKWRQLSPEEANIHWRWQGFKNIINKSFSSWYISRLKECNG